MPDHAARVESRPWSSAAWAEAFRLWAEAPSEIPWERGAELDDAERGAIRSSLQAFQLGESSEGRHLIGCARTYAEATGDHAYVEAARLFIAEEQRHARDLGRFLTLNGIPLIRRTWTDTVFRNLRRLAGLELSIAVLITAEIIAQVYYEAIRRGTGSQILRGLCERILCDEAEHVRFQSERLALLRWGCARWRVVVSQWLQRLFFAVTCVVVWFGHRRALQAGGFGPWKFLRESWRALEAAIVLMDPVSYREPETGRVDDLDVHRTRESRPRFARVLTGLVLFGIAFGFVESAVVIDLRAQYEPLHRRLHADRAPDDLFPMLTLDQLRAEGPNYMRLLGVELAREAATLVMLAAVAWSCSRSGREWLAAFVVAFGVWDIAFYVCLKVVLDWPASLLTWDVLFLLPVPWTGPVLAPMIVAMTMIIGGAAVLARESSGRPVTMSSRRWVAIFAGGAILIVAFCWDWRNAMAGGVPGSFPWALFALGEGVGLVGLWWSLASTPRPVRGISRPFAGVAGAN